MICDDVNRRLDALIDGEARGLRQVVDAARELPREITPERDLWPGIAARIEAEKVMVGGFGPTRAAWRSRRLWLAAAAVVTVAVTAFALLWRGRPPAQFVVSTNGTRTDLRLASLEADSVRATYAKARQELLTLLFARRSELAPETLKVIDENVLIIDDAVGKIQRALAQDPGNRELNTLLVAAYRQEIDLLRRVGTLVSRV